MRHIVKLKHAGSKMWSQMRARKASAPPLCLATKLHGWVLAGLVCTALTVPAVANSLENAAMLHGKWTLESRDGVVVSDRQHAYFQIEDGIISGFDGCNTFGGRLDNPSTIRSTQRACPDNQLNSFDAGKLVKNLGNPELVSVQNGLLRIRLKAELVFQKSQ